MAGVVLQQAVKALLHVFAAVDFTRAGSRPCARGGTGGRLPLVIALGSRRVIGLRGWARPVGAVVSQYLLHLAQRLAQG
ncbi:hypothetical protein D3C72_2041140 [compost metagenome]